MTFKKYPDIERLGHEDNRDLFTFQEDTLIIEDKLEWKVERTVISDIHKKILWAKYGWEQALKVLDNGGKGR